MRRTSPPRRLPELFLAPASRLRLAGDYTFSGRIKYWPCRRGVLPPSFWNPAVAERSARLPEQGLALDFVHGYGGRQNTAPNLFYLANGSVVYYVAGVAVVYHWMTRKQYFYFGAPPELSALPCASASRPRGGESCCCRPRSGL